MTCSFTLYHKFVPFTSPFMTFTSSIYVHLWPLLLLFPMSSHVLLLPMLISKFAFWHKYGIRRTTIGIKYVISWSHSIFKISFILNAEEWVLRNNISEKVTMNKCKNIDKFCYVCGTHLEVAGRNIHTSERMKKIYNAYFNKIVVDASWVPMIFATFVAEIFIDGSQEK